MPELPEVETIRRDLSEYVLNKKIVQVEVRSSSAIRFDHRTRFIKTIVGATISQIDRIGKLLICYLDNCPLILLCHLRMTGQLIYQDKDIVLGGGHSQTQSQLVLPHQHTRLWFTFEDHSSLFFNDARKFGYFKLIPRDTLPTVYAAFGIEPLTEEYTVKNFSNTLKGRKISIKAALLNQRLIAGIGNIYADEICFAAGVLPTRPIGTLTKPEIKKLFDQSQRIIALAIDLRGTTFNDYVDARGKRGSFLEKLQVYQRHNQPCFYCGAKIKKIKVAQRGTHVCETCQK